MRAFAGVVVFVLATVATAAQTPQPFPRPNQPRAETSPPPAGQKPATPASPAPAAPAQTPPTATASPAIPQAAPGQGGAPDLGGLPMYPNAVYLSSYDAGRGQRFYLYGVNLPYGEAVNYYRTALKQKGDELFQSPPTWQFDIARYRESDMAYPPTVTIKDYTWGGSAGYLNPKGGQPERFPTIVQVVLAPVGAK